MVEVNASAEPLLSESTAKFVVMSNVLGGIRDYDRGGWLAPDAHEDAALAVMGREKKLRAPRPLDADVRRLLRIAWQTELAARVSEAYDDDMLRRVAAQTLPVAILLRGVQRSPGNDFGRRSRM